MKSKAVVLTKVKLFDVLKYVLFFFLFYVLALGSINGLVFPFAFGMLFALVWCNQKVLMLAPIFVLSMFLTGFDIPTLLSAVCTVFVMLLTYGIHYKTKKPMNLALLGVYALLSQGASLFFGLTSGVMFVFPILSVVLGLLFMYATIKVFSAVLTRGFASKLTITEIICGGIVLLSIASGMSAVAIYDFSFVKLFATIVILVSAYTFNVTTSLFCAGVMGLGTLLATNNPVFLSAFIIWGLAVSAFKYRNRLLPVVALVLCEVVLGLYFKIYGVYGVLSAISVIIGSALFLICPSKLIEEVSGFFSTASDRLAMRNIVNRNREGLSRRLNELSDVFNEMDKVFRSMIQGGLTPEQAKTMLACDVKDRVCSDCPEKNKCHRAKGEEMGKVFEDFVSVAFERGRVSLLDIPTNMSSRCSRVNALIAIVNDLCVQYKKYATMMNNLDASKVLIAEQLCGISGIMKNLSKEVSINISFDAGRENKIVDELTMNNIICSDAVVYEQNLDVVNASIVVRTDCFDKEKIETVVSKVCGCKMVVALEEPSPRSGWTVVGMRTSPRFDVVFGTSSMTKTGSQTSGDSFSLMRIENDKFMLALCDGMGSGVKAEKSSNLAIGLVENFYKAGFDNDIILSSVNKLLALGNEEVFSALDLCVVDLRKGLADIIKLGAPNGFVKHTAQTDMIEASSLPLGILGQVEPFSKKLVLTNGDMIVICTDGISDSFFSAEDLKSFITNNTTSNPQILADEILAKAVENCKGSALDDMTVLCARVFEGV